MKLMNKFDDYFSQEMYSQYDTFIYCDTSVQFSNANYGRHFELINAGQVSPFLFMMGTYHGIKHATLPGSHIDEIVCYSSQVRLIKLKNQGWNKIDIWNPAERKILIFLIFSKRIVKFNGKFFSLTKHKLILSETFEYLPLYMSNQYDIEMQEANFI